MSDPTAERPWWWPSEPVQERLVWLAVILLIVAMLAGCDVRIGPVPAPRPCPDDGSPCPYKSVAPMDLPPELRAKNYAGGSCYWAALESVLRWQGQPKLADWWRENYRGGAYTEQVAEAADAAGLKFAYTLDGEAEFLAWCSDTKRGAAITYGQAHAITFCGYVKDDRVDLEGGAWFAVLLDNNDTDDLRRVPRAVFLSNWRQAGGDAITVVHTPSPPRPWIP